MTSIRTVTRKARAQSGTGGIIPNVTVDFTDAEFARQRDMVRTDPQNRAAINKFDPQLQKGLELLRGKLH